jgi:hypothetical protein
LEFFLPFCLIAGRIVQRVVSFPNPNSSEDRLEFNLPAMYINRLPSANRFSLEAISKRGVMLVGEHFDEPTLGLPKPLSYLWNDRTASVVRRNSEQLWKRRA